MACFLFFQNEVVENRPEADEDDISPIPEVRSIVSRIDDTTLPTLTFRMWVLGIVACAVQGFLETRAIFQENGFELPLILSQILAHGMGLVVAAVMPNKFVNVPFTRGFRFTLNPGPFSKKEHVLVCVFAFIGRMRPLLLHTIAISKLHLHEDIYITTAFLTTLSSFLMCFGFVGFFFNWVSSPTMWWPSDLLDVIFFRTMHEESDMPTKGIPYRMFFVIFFALGFVYQSIPEYFFPAISAISVVCWFSKGSVTAEQVGAGKRGLGLLSFSFDWPFASDLTGDPLCTPRFVLYNALAGFISVFYIFTPAIYWTNSYKTKSFPIFTLKMYDSNGRLYDIRRILNDDGLTFNEEKYKAYSPVHLSAFAIISLCCMVASTSASVVHVILNYGRDICKELNEDINNVLMRSYKPVPRRWFFIVFLIAFILAFVCYGMGFGPKQGFPLTVILAACVIAFPLVVPVGIFIATTSQMIPVSIVFRVIGGLLYPGDTLPYLIFTSFTYQLVIGTVGFLSCFKLGHYMKIPPQSMFRVVIVASIISVSTSFGTTWYYVDAYKDICNQENPSTGDRNCPLLDTLQGTTNMWGVVGTRRILQDGGYIPLFLAVIVLSMAAEILVSLSSRKWKFMRYVNLPVILGVTQGVPPTFPAAINTWLAVGILFPLVASKFFKNWNPKYQYLFSVSIVAGSSWKKVLVTIVEYLFHISKPEWWGSELDDHCPLAKCPTAPGVIVKGCPLM